MFDHLVLAFYSVDSTKIEVYFFHTTENQNRMHAIFLHFVPRCYQVIIMICKHGAI